MRSLSGYGSLCDIKTGVKICVHVMQTHLSAHQLSLEKLEEASLWWPVATVPKQEGISNF